DAVRNRKPQTRAAADGLRAEERIVNAGEMFRRDARAGISDLGDSLIAIDPGIDSEPAAAGHGIACVQKEIQKHLLKLMFNALHHHRHRRQLAPHANLPDRELMLEQREHISYDAIEIDR